jgi:hypothetical protein
MIKNIIKRLPLTNKSVHKIGLLVSSFLIVSALLLSHGASAANVSFNGPFDSDSNAVIYGGAADCTTVQQKYAADGSIQAIYAYFFIGQPTVDDLCNVAVAGVVTKSGDVKISTHLVATNALTAGRLNMPGSTKVEKNGVIFYVRTPSVSFVSDTLNAFVVMNNGKFLYAVLSSCGNPVAATPVETPVTPTPAPTPPPTPTPAPATINNVNNNQSTAVASVSNNIQILQQQQQAQTQAQTQISPIVIPATATTTTVAPTAAVLPNTGPGSIIALLGVTVGVATISHYIFTRRRLTRS